MRLLLAAVLLAACSRGPRVGPGSTVALEYELSSGGAVLETSAGREPVAAVQGAGDFPTAVDRALLGLRVGDVLVKELPPGQAFGSVDPDLIRAVPLAKFGAMAKSLKPGAYVAGASGGKAAQGKVLKIEGGAATLDFNHPLAGKTLRYKLKVVAIRPR